MSKWIGTVVEWAFLILVLPILSIIAVMDRNNGRTFWQNIHAISGREFEQNKRQQQKDLIDKTTKNV